MEEDVAQLRCTTSDDIECSQYSPNISSAPMVENQGASKAAQEPLFAGSRNRMPYFRWLGPTAIMPGFKQMVVKVRRRETDIARSSTDGGILSPSLNNLNHANPMESWVPSLYANPPATMDSDTRTPLNLPFYDTSPTPPSELITHLANIFFTHLGCNYPFLQRDRFLRDLDEKQVDAILVDAVCALAARFSSHPMLKQQTVDDEKKASPAEYGHAFAVRAKAALVDTFACPTVAAVQAALLLAYNEFGEGRDSGLWMYLGISIRMAQDLGMHKLEGLRYMGKSGPTPKMVKRESQIGLAAVAKAKNKNEGAPVARAVEGTGGRASPDQQEMEEQKAVEQERVDTFWAVFFLDRVVSSGTGRRSTLRDKDIELSFPTLDQTDPKSGWPAPFPALIQIVHLYGRVADLLNSIKEPSDITSDTPKRLAAMELQVTDFYQGLPQKLHCDAVSFQYYMKAGEGTNFVLMHFWFHTLILLLHQPTLLKTFEGHMLQLFPNSHQLSMSSAKTIADILSYSQLMDIKASLGNPFTSQPIYIAACAFLRETAERTATSNAQSRAGSPLRKAMASSGASSTTGTRTSRTMSSTGGTHGTAASAGIAEVKSLSKHTLLATAASQHYQLCYQALQSIETYWSGAKYILTILDQKFEGVEDPLLYTVEEGECSMELPKPEPAFTSPGWRRKLLWGTYPGVPSLDAIFETQNQFFPANAFTNVPGSPIVDPNQGRSLACYCTEHERDADVVAAIGWTLTGTMNSPSTNLAWHFANSENEQPSQPGPGSTSAAITSDFVERASDSHDSRAAKIPPRFVQYTRSSPATLPQDGINQCSRPPLSRYASSTSTADADLLLGLGSPFGPASAIDNTPTAKHTNGGMTPRPASYPQPAHLPGNGPSFHMSAQPPFPSPVIGLDGFFDPATAMHSYGGMMIESQDVDMSMLGLDMMPWFDTYPTHDLMGIAPVYDPATGAEHVTKINGNRGESSRRSGQHNGR